MTSSVSPPRFAETFATLVDDNVIGDFGLGYEQYLDLTWKPGAGFAQRNWMNSPLAAYCFQILMLETSVAAQSFAPG
jgi:hypothetical protein